MIKELQDNVEIFRGWCKKCGICTAFCPKGVLEIGEDGYPFVKYPERCNRCGLCEIRCPDFAMVVSKNDKEQKD